MAPRRLAVKVRGAAAQLDSIHFNNGAVKPTLLEICYVPIKTFRVIFPEEIGFLDGRKTDMSSERVV